MMLAASTSLVYEGITVENAGKAAQDGLLAAIPQSARVLLGIVGGLLFIVSTKRLLDEHEEIKIAGLDGEQQGMGALGRG
jgi:zinc transporter, ZIP family